MSDINRLCLWTLILIHADTVLCSTTPTKILVRDVGDAVVLSCLVEQTTLPPFGVYLKRSKLLPREVLFKYENTEAHILDPECQNRTSVSGDPNIHAVNVTITDLQPSDTDQYHCEFNVHNPDSADTVQRGTTDFFLLVRGVVDVDRDWVNTCVGGSALLPCVSPVEDSSAVEGVVLKRQRGRWPVELLYHSKHTSWSSRYFVDRVQLSTAPGPGGISYSLTVGALQPEDSGLYSCQLLLQGRPHSLSMGPQGRYVSVQDDQCGCSSYSTLIYALSAAVAVTFTLLLVTVLVHRVNNLRATATPAPPPIYEEMTGLQPLSSKRSKGHADEPQSEYRNISLNDPRLENHYESPNGAIIYKDE
ncbi:hypothetical protein NL108_005118 [Boleophthalmus pectinirostris]|uniref:cd7 antigen-like isoform X2 n=1 Tax=Boleophthalmus pectinirostris TaxID=150288 RepID=UPI00242C0EF7|nr:cd7 antigen-like isoform X2 [Boleophthalmus pectinirostris]KAJ0050731.1 hypothetical protein NL108_005118 [Boleophthalmus pectinirostris]